MQLQPGAYTIDLVVKDRLSGKAAAKRQKLALPVTDAEFSATEVVLSRHAEPLRQPPTGPADVLSAGNVQIRPSPSREFLPTDNLIMFFKIYNPTVVPVTGKALVKVTVTLLKDGKQATKPFDYELNDIIAEPVPQLIFAKYIKLAGLASGRYSAVIEIRDVPLKKVVKQEAFFEIK
jgi:hypothetical protein